jgi:hypothetical protein
MTKSLWITFVAKSLCARMRSRLSTRRKIPSAGKWSKRKFWGEKFLPYSYHMIEPKNNLEFFLSANSALWPSAGSEDGEIKLLIYQIIDNEKFPAVLNSFPKNLFNISHYATMLCILHAHKKLKCLRRACLDSFCWFIEKNTSLFFGQYNSLWVWCCCILCSFIATS